MGPGIKLWLMKNGRRIHIGAFLLFLPVMFGSIPLIFLFEDIAAGVLLYVFVMMVCPITLAFTERFSGQRAFIEKLPKQCIEDVDLMRARVKITDGVRSYTVSYRGDGISHGFIEIWTLLKRIPHNLLERIPLDLGRNFSDHAYTDDFHLSCLVEDLKKSIPTVGSGASHIVNVSFFGLTKKEEKVVLLIAFSGLAETSQIMNALELVKEAAHEIEYTEIF